MGIERFSMQIECIIICMYDEYKGSWFLWKIMGIWGPKVAFKDQMKLKLKIFKRIKIKMKSKKETDRNTQKYHLLMNINIYLTKMMLGDE